MSTLAEALAKLNGAKHRQQIYMELVNFLSKFVEDEVHKPDVTMVTEGLGAVPQDLLREVLDELNKDRIDPLSEMIESIQGLSVEVPGGQKRKRPSQSRKKAEKGKQSGEQEVPVEDQKADEEKPKPKLKLAGLRQLRHRGSPNSSGSKG
jgi:hypothetical protein